jgi:hypothetical protein
VALDKGCDFIASLANITITPRDGPIAAIRHSREWTRSHTSTASSDCLLSIADYGRGLSGRRYRRCHGDGRTDRSEALAIVPGGRRCALLGGALMGAGFVPVDDYRRGDALVVNSAAALRSGRCIWATSVAMRLARGVIKVPAKFIKVVAGWRWEGLRGRC